MDVLCYNKTRGVNMISYDLLKKEIEQLIDPGFNQPIGEVKGLKKLVVDPTGVVETTILLKRLGGQEENSFKIELVKLVKVKLGFPGIKMTFERNEFTPAGKKIIRYIGIASGKGGVGKSTVTANLAYALTRLGKKIGIIDADVYGATIAEIYGIPNAKPTGTSEETMKPPKAKGVEIISTSFFVETGKPVMWRGPMLGKLLNHYFYGVDWHKDTDFVLVDLPPGTGDIALDINKYAPQTKMIIVTTPHHNASSVALKAGTGARQIGHEIIGVVENMSYYSHFVNNTEMRDYIFGQGGGLSVAETLNVDLLAEIPLGRPEQGNLYESSENIGKVYDELAKKILKLVENN